MGISSNPSRLNNALSRDVISVRQSAGSSVPRPRPRFLGTFDCKSYGSLGPEPLTIAACVSQRRGVCRRGRDL